MKPLHYILISAVFMLSGCASSQYSSSDDGIYFNHNKQYAYPTAESSPAMAKTKQLNEKTQAVIATRMESPADKKQQVDTLYVTNENRTVEIDAEPDKTYLIVDESDSYARRLRMFEDDEYTPQTVNVNIAADYGFPYSPYYYSSWYRPWWGFNSYYYTPWYWGTYWTWYNYWDSWYYPGYYRPWYYGGYYGYYYPHHHHHHHDYYHNYSSNTNYGRRLANAGTARRTSSVGSSRSSTASAANTTRYSTATRTRPQIQRVAGSTSPQSSGNTGEQQCKLFLATRC